jgi:Phage integrase family
MNDSPLLDAAGRCRSPATMPGFHRGRPPRNRGLRYPADPPPVEEVVAVMRLAGASAYRLRTRARIVVLWRAGLRISEALALAESDLDRDRGAILVRRGKGGKRREVGMDRWAWEQSSHAGTSPTGDERHSESQSGPRADSVKASQLAAGRSLTSRPDVTAPIQTASVKAEALMWKRSGSGKPQQAAAAMRGPSLAERRRRQEAVDRSTCSRLTSRRSPVRARHRPLAVRANNARGWLACAASRCMETQRDLALTACAESGRGPMR